MTDFPDYQEPQANASAIGATNLVGTGLARESGGNLDTHTTLLEGTATGALIAGVGRTIGQEVAAQIATGSPSGTPGGAPLLHGARQVFSVTGHVIAAGATFTTNSIPFTRPGYLFNIRAQMAIVGSPLPSVNCDLTWSIGPIANGASAEEQWFVPAGGSSTKRTTGRGPTKGDTLQLALTNGDSVNAVTVSVVIWETTQHIPRDDWRSDGPVASSGASAATSNTGALTLGNDSFTVPGSSTAFRNLPLYAGQATIWLNQNTGAGSQVDIVPVGQFGPAAPNPIASLDWTAPPHQLVGVMLPRAWCQLQAINNAAGGVILTYGITALEFAS